MKAQLLVNLKYDGGIATAGSVFDEPFPDYIQNNLEYPKIVKVFDEPQKQEEKITSTKTTGSKSVKRREK